MPRHNRSSLPDGGFHLIAHAVADEPLFFDDMDRKIYLGLLQIAIERYRWRVVSFVLLDTHLHALVIATTSDLSDGLWWLHTHYARRFHARHPHRRGHVFERRPRTKPIRDEPYFSAVLRYIAQNPVKAFICSRPEDYRWSAHRAIVGAGPALPFLALEEIHARFGDDPGHERYAAFVLGEDPPGHGRVRRWSEEAPCDRPRLEELLDAGPEPSALRAAHEEWDYTVRELAAAAGISIGAVSNRIARDRQR